MVLLNVLVDYVPAMRAKCSDGTTRAELWVSVIHQVVVCGGFLIVFLALHVNNDFSHWWHTGPVYDFTLERQVQLSIFGYELKDLAYGCIHWTWLVHHTITFGCLYVLFLPAGLGLLTLVGIIAELGSAVFNLSILYESSCMSLTYFIGMFISNGLAVVGAVALFWVDMAVGWQVGYSVIVGLLFILRTEGLRRAICEFMTPEAADEGNAVALDVKHVNLD